MKEALFYLPLAICVITSLVLLLNLPWRWLVISLSVQYLAVFGLLVQSWSFGLAAVFLLVGWMSGAVLGASHPPEPEVGLMDVNLSGNIFRIFAAFLVGIAMTSAGIVGMEWIPAPLPALLSGLILVGMGLLQLGMTTKPFRATIGLLTVLSGFEVVYASLVTSVLVTGLLAVVTLGLALVGSYLMNAATLEEPE